MLNALIGHVGSGQSFFSGVILIGLAVAGGFAPTRRWLRLGRILAGCVGLALVVVSSTPSPLLWVGTAAALTVAWIGVEASCRAPDRIRSGVRVAALVIWVVGAVLELPHHQMPTLLRSARLPGGIAVIGDSITAGLGSERETWPAVLARTHGVAVRDLSRAGANVATARRDQAGGVQPGDRLVLLEIGGNDVLGATSADDFERGLRGLLEDLHRDGRTLVMLELPLPPLFHRFGAIQRRLARQFDVILIPKRILLGVLTTEGATVDTIHLSPAGQTQMAEVIGRILGPALSPEAARSDPEAQAHSPSKSGRSDRSVRSM